MKQLSKREASIYYVKQHMALFACPLCQAKMQLNDTGTMGCSKNHSFDMAKQGYMNFMTKPVATMYSKELFEARQEVIASGLYDPLQQKIAELLVGEQIILDTGCGEGSHLARICAQIPNAVGVGIDIAKEGIIAAAKFYSEKIWCVGDLANSPFQSASFTTILNILSPANYEEFKRLLQPNGKVIKVVPQEGYLKELRVQAFADSEKENYSNIQTVERFKESFAHVNVHRLTYTIPLATGLVSRLLQMTPMGWHIENSEAVELPQITIDVDILIGEGE
ncbi:methyltransferase domain-containing protein [Metasolibacillus meyeri]|uniref:Methyltransferase domain-containing protein n=1 Tax=Metasolibacillus meyeri TaxID=1071052 RepID=A0AAW9NPL5_9BACL|nr:methyltransferase domain-containing protein [Metasolibacillus meyeri]MEC1177950.1 methyltransferase domain-containing protein [Metasolibacillus meyeri]